MPVLHSHACAALYSILACQLLLAAAFMFSMPFAVTQLQPHMSKGVVNMVAAHAACTRHSFCSRGKLAHGMQVVHEFSDAKDPLQLSSHSLGVSQAQQAQQAAADQLVAVSNLTVSSTGKWAAVVKGSHVHVFELEAMTYHGRLPALQVGVQAPSCCFAVLLCTVYMSCAFR